ncbi:MAG: FGGY family carbohydrate kinase [Saprospiraceae bacterium]
MFLLGYDIGSSSIKAALVHAESGEVMGISHAPETEMPIDAIQADWAEQDPEMWWQYLATATFDLLQKTKIDTSQILSIGISYQMHGLVLVDKEGELIRPSIIWCDSRAVSQGENAFQKIGKEFCLFSLLNSPGNFTAAKLKWVQENEPDNFAKIHKIMLPGEYIAYRMTGEIITTPSGLSEGVFWDFRTNGVSRSLMEHFKFDNDLLPEIRPVFSEQGKLNEQAAEKLGLKAGIPISYRAGDQPNNALSLGVIEPGQIAATGGTSGVVYGVVNKPVFDQDSRVNAFAHVNHQSEYLPGNDKERIGVLLCINGTGIQYSWLKKIMAEEGWTYESMEKEAASVPVGSDGIKIFPFGNGAERMLKNKTPGGSIRHLNFNRHGKKQLTRAALEGIAFAMVYGMKIMQSMGIKVELMRVGNDNLFQSEIFSQTIANCMNCQIEMIETTGAVGAAKGSGFGIGYYKSLQEAVNKVHTIKSFKPNDAADLTLAYYHEWETELNEQL